MIVASEQIDKINYKLATKGYLYELGLLARIVKSQEFNALLPLFSDYERFLLSEREELFGANLLRKMVNDERVIDVAGTSVLGKQLTTCANMAACCEVFGGWTVPVGDLDESRVHEYLKLALSHTRMDKQAAGRRLAVRLNKGDTARVVSLLKMLGLLPIYTHTCDQLSLCSSI